MILDHFGLGTLSVADTREPIDYQPFEISIRAMRVMAQSRLRPGLALKPSLGPWKGLIAKRPRYRGPTLRAGW